VAIKDVQEDQFGLLIVYNGTDTVSYGATGHAQKHISNNLTLEKVFCEVIDLKQKLLFPAAVLRIWMDRHHSFVSCFGYLMKNF